MEIARNASLSLPARVAAFGAACQLDWNAASPCAEELLTDSSFEMRRTAAEAIGHQMSAEQATLSRAQPLLNLVAKDAHPAVQRAAALAAGAVGSLAAQHEVKETIASGLLAQLVNVDRND